MRADGIVLRLVALDQKGGAAFEKAQIALAVRAFVQPSIERRHLLAAVAAHAPEASVVAADPVMNQGAVRIAVDGAQMEAAEPGNGVGVGIAWIVQRAEKGGCRHFGTSQVNGAVSSAVGWRRAGRGAGRKTASSGVPNVWKAMRRSMG